MPFSSFQTKLTRTMIVIHSSSAFYANDSIYWMDNELFVTFKSNNHSVEITVRVVSANYFNGLKALLMCNFNIFCFFECLRIGRRIQNVYCTLDM